MSSSYTPSPVQGSERIVLLDSLRGFAILGILLMNILVFGIPDPAGWNPGVLDEKGIDYWCWYFMMLIPEGTQRAIFSTLFGAGVLLFTSRIQKRLPGLEPADYFLRRQLWLLLFGLFDIYILLWEGDILFDYACYGIILFVFRDLSPKKLIIAAMVCFLLTQVRENRDMYQVKDMIRKAEVALAMDTTTVKWTSEQRKDAMALQEMKDSEKKENRLKEYEEKMKKAQGNYADAYRLHTNSYLDHSLIHYVYLRLWEVLMFMFLGMAFLKLGVLTGEAPLKWYWIMSIVGLGVGLSLGAWNLGKWESNNFSNYATLKDRWIYLADISRCFRAMGILGTLILMYRSGIFKWLFLLMKPVGQMAFTNYLTQSIICGLYFNGFGWGMYGKLARHELYIFVGVIWLIQIVWSNIWLRYFRFGPLEWCWRSLTYWNRQPLRR